MRTQTIEPLHQESMEACRLRIDNLIKPIYSLAHLEKMIERLAGILQNPKPENIKQGLVVFAADHAVDSPFNIAKGEVSAATLERMNDGFSPANSILRDLQADAILIDLGLQGDVDGLENVRHEKLCRGTSLFSKEYAMTEETLGKAMEIGFALAEEMKREGYGIVGIGNIGERAFLSALAVTGAITGKKWEELVEEREGISPKALLAMLAQTSSADEAVKKSIFSILETYGSPDMAAMTGFILGAAVNHMAIVFDNELTGAAVLAAIKMNPLVRDYVFTSAVYNNAVHFAQMEYLDTKAFLHYEFTIEEGLGSAMGLSIMHGGLHMLNDMKTFGEAGVGVAEDGQGKGRQDEQVQ